MVVEPSGSGRMPLIFAKARKMPEQQSVALRTESSAGVPGSPQSEVVINCLVHVALIIPRLETMVSLHGLLLEAYPHGLFLVAHIALQIKGAAVGSVPFSPVHLNKRYWAAPMGQRVLGL